MNIADLNTGRRWTVKKSPRADLLAEPCDRCGVLDWETDCNKGQPKREQARLRRMRGEARMLGLRLVIHRCRACTAYRLAVTART